MIHNLLRQVMFSSLTCISYFILISKSHRSILFQLVIHHFELFLVDVDGVIRYIYLLISIKDENVRKYLTCNRKVGTLGQFIFKLHVFLGTLKVSWNLSFGDVSALSDFCSTIISTRSSENHTITTSGVGLAVWLNSTLGHEKLLWTGSLQIFILLFT